MPKHPNAGDLRTPVYIFDRTVVPDGQGYDTKTWTAAFGGSPVYARWEGQRVADTVEDGRAGITEKAHIIMRRTDAVTATCRLRRSAADAWWYVAGSPYASGNGAYIEFDVERKAVGI